MVMKLGGTQDFSLPLGVAQLPLGGRGTADPEFLRKDTEHCHQGHLSCRAE